MARDADRRDRGQGGHGKSRDVQISKALSLLLRHAAEKEGVKMNAEGYVNVADVLQWRKLKSIKCTFDEIKNAVDTSDKKRFALLHIPSAQPTESTTTATTVLNPDSADASESTNANESQPASSSILEVPSTAEEQTDVTQQALSVTDANPANYLIRATQGHSIKTVEAASYLEPLTLDDESKLPDTVVHGTFHGAWPLILQTGGLKCMNRNHVHFATGPSLESVLELQRENKKPTKDKTVISGMRGDAQILIYIDIRKALAAGCPFWRSENGVILSEGIPIPEAKDDAKGNPQKIVPLEFVEVVVERKLPMGKIWERGQVLQELPANLTLLKGPRRR